MNLVLVAHLEHPIQVLDVFVSDEPKASWLLRALVLKNYAVVHQSEFRKIRTKLFDLQILGKTAHKDLAMLGVKFIVARIVRRAFRRF